MTNKKLLKYLYSEQRKTHEPNTAQELSIEEFEKWQKEYTERLILDKLNIYNKGENK